MQGCLVKFQVVVAFKKSWSRIIIYMVNFILSNLLPYLSNFVINSLLETMV